MVKTNLTIGFSKICVSSLYIQKSNIYQTETDQYLLTAWSLTVSNIKVKFDN